MIFKMSSLIELGKAPDLSGKRFGYLVAYEYLGKSYWKCKCDCGKDHVVRSDHLNTEKTKSCGCKKFEMMVKSKTGHKLSNNSAYSNWMHMMSRCYNPKNDRYADYGGRGIKVCERWHSVENFISDMGERPSRVHSVDRKDVNGDYCPENCRWATFSEQNMNTRRNVLLTLGDETMPLTAWAHKLGIKPATITARLKYGWSHERALTEPVASRFH